MCDNQPHWQQSGSPSTCFLPEQDRLPLKNPNPQERRRMKRLFISQYIPVTDTRSGQGIGHLVDVSPLGFRMDSQIPIAPNQRYDLRLDFPQEIAGRTWIEFTALARWCRSDPIQPQLYNAGFEIISMTPEDLEIFKLMARKYGAG